MSDSDRSDRTEAVGPVFAILAAIVIVATIVGTIAFSQGVEAERRNDAPTAYAEAAKDDALRSCVEGEAAAVFDCIYEKVEASQEQAQAEQDLDAQQGMKLWAAIMAALTFGTLVLTGVALWFIKGTLDATADMVGEAKELTQETIKATNAMVEANGIAREAAFNQARAHLFPINVTIKDVGLGKRPVIENQFGNQGVSFAENVTASTSFALFPDDVAEEFLIKPDLKQASKGTVSPNVSQVIWSEGFHVMNKGMWDKFTKGEANYIYFGHFKYETLGQKCETHFRYICRMSNRKDDGTYSLVVAKAGNWAT